MQETTPLSFQNVPPLPFDILFKIHDYAQHADLPALCRVSKTFHDCASNFLYRDISAVNILDVCRTLSQSPGLATRVRHFELTPASREHFIKKKEEIGDGSGFALVGNALRSMTRLRSLKLTMEETYSDILPFCTAQIQSFHYSFLCDHNLIRFLHSQRDLTTLKLWCDLEDHSVLSTCLPKLTKLDAPMSWLIALIPGRSIKEVIFHERRRLEAPIIDIAFLESSLPPIRTLTVGSPLLYALTLSQVTSILPAVEKLTIETPKIGKYFHDAVSCPSQKVRSPLTVIFRKQNPSESGYKSYSPPYLPWLLSHWFRAIGRSHGLTEKHWALWRLRSDSHLISTYLLWNLCVILLYVPLGGVLMENGAWAIVSGKEYRSKNFSWSGSNAEETCALSLQVFFEVHALTRAKSWLDSDTVRFPDC